MLRYTHITHPLPDGEGYEVLVSAEPPRLVYEPLRPEAGAVPPVVPLQHLGEQRLHQRVGGDGVALHLQVPGADVLDTWGRGQ